MGGKGGPPDVLWRLSSPPVPGGSSRGTEARDTCAAATTRRVSVAGLLLGTVPNVLRHRAFEWRLRVEWRGESTVSGRLPGPHVSHASLGSPSSSTRRRAETKLVLWGAYDDEARPPSMPLAMCHLGCSPPSPITILGARTGCRGPCDLTIRLPSTRRKPGRTTDLRRRVKKRRDSKTCGENTQCNAVEGKGKTPPSRSCHGKAISGRGWQGSYRAIKISPWTIRTWRGWCAVDWTPAMAPCNSAVVP